MAKDGENQFDGTKNEEILHTVDENRALRIGKLVWPHNEETPI